MGTELRDSLWSHPAVSASLNFLIFLSCFTCCSAAVLLERSASGARRTTAFPRFPSLFGICPERARVSGRELASTCPSVAIRFIFFHFLAYHSLRFPLLLPRSLPPSKEGRTVGVFSHGRAQWYV